MKKWSVYILRCHDDTLYTGISTDVARRIKAHSAGKGAKYTKYRTPLCLIYQENAHTHSSALKREAAIKSMSRTQKLELVENQHP